LARPCSLLLLALVVIGGGEAQPGSALAVTLPQSGPPTQPLAFDYHLHDTWGEQAWRPAAGRFVSVSDTSTAPDGRTWVLDGRGGALHVLDASGEPRRRFVLPDELLEEGWLPRRMDAAPDGGLAILATGRDESGDPRSRIAVLDGLGRLEAVFDQPLAYRDIAAGQAGRLYLVRTVPREPPPPSRDPGPRPPGGIDAFDQEGGLLASAAEPALYLPVAVDAHVTPRGERLYISNWLPSPAGQPPPDPAPTPRPSWRMDQGGGEAERAQEGVVVLDDTLARRAFFAFYAPEDVAAGPAGLFVARASELWRLSRQADADPALLEPPQSPLWSLATAQISIPSYGPILTLDAPPAGAPGAGTVRVGLEHCQLRAVARFEARALFAETASPQRFTGQSDRPPLGGPFFPQRIAGDAGAVDEDDVAGIPSATDAALLQGRFTLADPRAPALPVEVGTWGSEPQSVQLWRSGRPLDQLALCGDEPNWFERRHDARWALDVALDGPRVYTAGPELLRARHRDPGQPLPLWTWWAGEVSGPTASNTPAPPDASAPSLGPEVTPRIGAISAHQGRIAVLDIGRGLLMLLDETAAVQQVWSTARPLAGAVPVDVALGAEQVVVALSDGEVASWSLLDRSAPPRRWRAWDTPWRTAMGPSGDIFLLTRGGWLARHDREGELRALRRLPGDALPTAADLTVLASGELLVSFARAEARSSGATPAPTTNGAPPVDWEVMEAGVWRFTPQAREAPAAFAREDGCWAVTDKAAAPPVVRRGAPVSVTLSVQTGCPEQAPPLELALVIDASRSMNWDGALERAQRLLLELLAGLPATTRLRMVAFDAEARLLAADAGPADTAAQIAALAATGDTRLGAALSALADWPPALTLTPPPPPLPLTPTPVGGATADPDPPVRRVLLLVTDGELKDHPQAEADALAARGVELHVLALTHPTFDALRRGNLARLVGSPERVWVDLDAARLAALRSTLLATRFPDPEGVIGLEDGLPEDMAFEIGSARPPGAWQAASRILRWPERPASTAPLTWTLGLRPQELGLRPTNTFARGMWRSAAGDVALGFPLPKVKVWDASSLRFRAWLPATTRGACLRRAPLALALVIDASRSMDEPLERADSAATPPAPRTKLDAAKDAARMLLAALGPGERAALLSFAEQATLLSALDADPAAQDRALTALSTAPGTRLDRAMLAAEAALSTRGPSERPMVILLSDGRQEQQPETAVAAAAALEARGVPRVTVALGASADRRLLADIASGGQVLEVLDGRELGQAFVTLLERVRCASEGVGAP
jgi:Mg-chelatase subunit ChlD